QEARRKKIYGQLRLVVSLLPDGSIHNIEILQSSGQRILDDAAIRIVRMAAPFAPFPHELRKDVDRLEIIRTWKFEKGDKLTSE
ncbi:MAG TPA: energy transducer TonB, partial [Pseudomonadales bacterium]|nr:energy transducer TonB [Pseudomonadales bacterium]